MVGPPEAHASYRSNWLRAAVLGANDGILSVSSLILGVSGSGASRQAVITAGIAALVAGALSMAAGEYVSVSSQRDTENADVSLERRELEQDPDAELQELANIYEQRGLPPDLARQVSEALSARDPLAAHIRDELGLEHDRRARPLQAAGSSALAFSSGGILPLLAAVIVDGSLRTVATAAVTLLALAGLGFTGARIGGADELRATIRVTVWGAVAMAFTYAIGAAVGSAV
ncbi:MAG TPA: VIT family protein [Solirubrobacteraceae bacterium]